MFGPKLNYMNIAEVQKDNVHGKHDKDMVVLHETISPNYEGWSDIIANSEYLDSINYGIHGITDGDGNIAWSLGLGTAIFYHTASSGSRGDGNVNTRSIGIEQVSRVPLDYSSNADRRLAWLRLDKELTATAKLIAAIARAHDVPLITSTGRDPGITTHWLVTQTFGVAGGHTDCWPVNNGGYYPLSEVIKRARMHYYLGTHF